MNEAAGGMIAIAVGAWSARISPLGAALADLRREGAALLAHPATVDPVSGYHGAVLAPWPGRVPFGSYTFKGVEQRLAISEPAYGHALHGLVANREWEVVAQSDREVTLRHTIDPEPGYPFSVALTVRYRMSRAGLRCTVHWSNRSEVEAPFGVGFHPYFTLGDGVDSMTLDLPAAISVDSNTVTKVPLPVREVDERDFSRPHQIGPGTFARCYGGLPRTRGWAHATLTGPGARGIRISADAAFGWFQVYTGDLPRPDLARRGFALEPQTCPPGAFVTGHDLLVLAPGESGSGTWTVASA